MGFKLMMTKTRKMMIKSSEAILLKIKFMSMLSMTFFALMNMTTQASKLTKEEESIVESVNSNFQQQLIFLEKTVNINSGTLNLEGIKAVGEMYKQAFNDIGFNTRWQKLPKEVNRADHLISESLSSSHKDAKNIMLIGHLDTVFSRESPFQSFKKQGNKITGPGVTDMKDGNSVILFALKALNQNKLLSSSNIRVILNSDEESVGRPLEDSRKPMIDMAKKSDYALSFESGWKDYATISRRGFSSWVLEVNAKQAHSSGIFSEGTGAGAIFESSRILSTFYQQLRKEQGLTFSPGLSLG